MNSTELSNYKIAVMSREEVAIAISWAKREGWNPGVHDASLFYESDPTGFLAGKYEGQIIATISAVKYGADFGFIGLYIVKDVFRGNGFGIKIWESAMCSLSGRNIGLDGVLSQQDNYKKSGFKLAHRNIRFAGKTKQNLNNTRAIEAKYVAFKELENYDSRFFPIERRDFLERWIAPENSNTLLWVENSKILGYGSIRACDRGFKIGPLNAESADVADELLSALMATVPEGSDVFLDVPELNTNAVQLAHKFGMMPVFETARMYTQHFPNLPMEKIFGITTFELG